MCALSVAMCTEALATVHATLFGLSASNTVSYTSIIFFTSSLPQAFCYNNKNGLIYSLAEKAIKMKVHIVFLC
jgi:hypothetical protein